MPHAQETSIDLCFRLKQDVGSHALMGDTGFEQMDFLQALHAVHIATRVGGRTRQALKCSEKRIFTSLSSFI